MAEKRLDIFVKEKLGISRSEAARLIKEGGVICGGRLIRKPGAVIDEENDRDITIDRSMILPYVSRGGLKLEAAAAAFGTVFEDKVCLDIGASTGGFTHFMLKKGARLVYAVDVGTMQLDERLRNDSRVVSMERTNILDVDRLEETPDIAVADVSFVSLRKITEKAKSLISPVGECIFLIKPQFEAGRENLNKKGICRDPKIHKRVIGDIILALEKTGLYTSGLIYSPIKGGDGNIEYLLHASPEPKDSSITASDIDAVVKSAHLRL